MFVVSVRERGKEEHKFTFRKPGIIIGRLRSNDIILPKRNISKRHARLELTEEGQIMLLDNGSTNGSYLNGKKVGEPTTVGPEDKLFMGDYILQAQILEEKSAIDGLDDGGGQVVGGESPGQDRPTVADIDSNILDDELRRMEEEQNEQGPATVVVDPMDVPTEPPPGLSDATGLDISLPEEDLADTMRFKDAGESSGGEVQFEVEDEGAPVVEAPSVEEASGDLEELIDIALEDEFEATIDPAKPLDIPVDEPLEIPVDEPLDIPVDEPLEIPVDEPLEIPAALAVATTQVDGSAFAPAVVPLKAGLSHALENHYDDIAEAYDKWLEEDGQPEGAREQVGSLLIDALGDDVGEQLDELVDQVAAELSYVGVVATLLENPQVGEVFVAPSGRIQTFDWAGNRIETGASLSCPAACARIAERVVDAAGDTGESFAEARLVDNTLARVFMVPFAAEVPALRFVRPFLTPMSLAKLQETGAITDGHVAELQKAISARRNILITGPKAATMTLLVHSLVGAIDPSERLLVSGDRFADGPGLENATIFTARAVHTHDFSEACSQMGFDRIILENGAGDTAAATIELGALLQIPFVVSARLNDPSNVSALLGMSTAETRLAFLDSLNRAGVILVATSDAGVDSISLFTLEGGEPKLVDMSA
jgi:pilus assembly protein CpaF